MVAVMLGYIRNQIAHGQKISEPIPLEGSVQHGVVV